MRAALRRHGGATDMVENVRDQRARQAAKHLIQVLLPVTDNEGRPFGSQIWEELKAALIEQFGGVTGYTRAPAEGVWAPAKGEREHDNIFIVEVIADDLNREWWKGLRRQLEATLHQEQIIVRALPMSIL